MIVWSKQHKLISDISLSFKKQQKIFTKVSGNILSRDQVFLRESKYLTRTEADFKFLVMWTVFKLNTSKIDTFKTLQGYQNDDFKLINKEKERIVLYINTLKNDFEYTNSKTLTTQIVLEMYRKNLVSCLFVYWYFQDEPSLTRIQQRTVDRVKFFLSYFPVIENYIISL